MVSPKAREALQQLPSDVSLSDFLIFARLALHLLTTDPARQNDIRVPDVLSSMMQVPPAGAQACWQLLHEESESRLGTRLTDEAVLEAFGGREGLSSHDAAFCHFRLPYSDCPHGCKNAQGTRCAKLTDTYTYKATLYTFKGPVPVLHSSKACRSCHRRFSYMWEEEGQQRVRGSRVYYLGAGSFEHLHVLEHSFVERCLALSWTFQTVHAWTSATNVAHIYNSTHDLHKGDALALTTEATLETFYLLGLLSDAAERREKLVLLPEDRKSLDGAMARRNQRMIDLKQPGYFHICDRCTEVTPREEDCIDEQGDVETRVRLEFNRAVVTDGTCLGHPRCAAPRSSGVLCKNELASPRDHFCPAHQDLARVCRWPGCEAVVTAGWKTCELAEHRGLEERLKGSHGALFQHQRLLRRSGAASHIDMTSFQTSHNSDFSVSMADLEIDEAERADETARDGGVADGADGNPGGQQNPHKVSVKERAKLSRARTHNEQLVVACCGTILSRGTFYDAEALDGVREFLRGTFPTPESLPSFIFYDSACQLVKHLVHIEDTYFQSVAFPVDPLHFRGHKETDLFCRQFCNPELFPEIIADDGSWRFNSSAAEQANLWINGFFSIVREMSAVHFAFFLDKVIKRKNNFTFGNLKRSGANPVVVPRDHYFPG